MYTLKHLVLSCISLQHVEVIPTDYVFRRSANHSAFSKPQRSDSNLTLASYKSNLSAGTFQSRCHRPKNKLFSGKLLWSTLFIFTKCTAGCQPGRSESQVPAFFRLAFVSALLRIATVGVIVYTLQTQKKKNARVCVYVTEFTGPMFLEQTHPFGFVLVVFRNLVTLWNGRPGPYPHVNKTPSHKVSPLRSSLSEKWASVPKTLPISTVVCWCGPELEFKTAPSKSEPQISLPY